MLKTCRHSPPCPTIDPWVCSQRSIYELGVRYGHINRREAESILKKWGTVMTPESKVYKGQPAPPSLFKSEL